MRRLRGTRLDPLGYMRERRRERALIEWYDGVLDHLVAALDVDNVATAAEIAALPLEIRGFGPVQDEVIARIQMATDARLTAFGATHQLRRTVIHS